MRNLAAKWKEGKEMKSAAIQFDESTRQEKTTTSSTSYKTFEKGHVAFASMAAYRPSFFIFLSLFHLFTILYKKMSFCQPKRFCLYAIKWYFPHILVYRTCWKRDDDVYLFLSFARERVDVILGFGRGNLKKLWKRKGFVQRGLFAYT